MNLSHLQHHYQELLSYMKEHNYSVSYINKFRMQILYILKNADTAGWESYQDIYREHEKKSCSTSFLRNQRTIIGAIEKFDLEGLYPDGRSRRTLFHYDSFDLLADEFRSLLLFYIDYERRRGKKESTIYTESHNASCFFIAMQNRNCFSLDEITENDVMSFFVSDAGERIRSCSYRKNISAVLKAGIHWKEMDCHRILFFLPMLREKRQNIQYLTDSEIKTLTNLLADNVLSSRNRAILALLIYTGLRSCDIAEMKKDSVNWEQDVIHICQQKTSEPLELPLSAVVGNAIFDYLEQERPASDDPHLFLTETKPYTPLKSGSVGSIVCKIMRIAGIRQDEGDRKGTHIFRHHLATVLLENGIPRPVISQTLGHTAPDSLEPYLRADFIHLKECAVSIEEFPVPEEVFSL